jgi:hypothetical protein
MRVSQGRESVGGPASKALASDEHLWELLGGAVLPAPACEVPELHPGRRRPTQSRV